MNGYIFKADSNIALNKKKVIAKRTLGSYLFRTIILFFYLFEVQVINTSSLFSSRKIIFVSFCILIPFMSRQLHEFRIFLQKDKYIKELCALQIIIIIYAYFLSLYWSNKAGSSMMPYLISFLLYVCIGVPLFYVFFKDTNEFLNCLIGACVLQAIITILQYTSLDFRIFLHSTFVDVHNTSYLKTGRAVGLSAGGATLSLYFFVGMLACVYFIFLKKNNSIYLFIYGLLLVTSILAGTTGFIMGIVLLVLLLYRLVLKVQVKKIVNFLLIGTILLIIFFQFYHNDSILRTNAFENSFNKIWEQFFEEESIGTLEHIAYNQITAPISAETIVGTSIYKGTTVNGTVSTSDSGYVRTYFGIGLIAAIIFYINVFIQMYKEMRFTTDKNIRWLLLFYIISIFITEYKEPFIFKCVMPFVFFLWCVLLRKETDIKEFQELN